MTIDQVFDLLAIDQEDRADCSRLLDGEVDQAAVAEATTALTRRLGSYREDPIGAATTDPMAWLTAFLQLTPVLVDWHRGLGVSSEITRATLADVGRNIAIHRKAHAAFGLETWDWLIPHYTGMLFALGRLNYMLHPTKESVGGAMSPGDWVPGIHIPESGPLTPEAVDASLVQAKAFFRVHFPDKPIAVAACVTWLLDPYLVRQMPATTNIGAFVRRFAPIGHPYDDATAALFFVFRTRELNRIPALPRETMLQRMILDRAERGDAWQIGSGYLRL